MKQRQLYIHERGDVVIHSEEDQVYTVCIHLSPYQSTRISQFCSTLSIMSDNIYK